MAKTRKQSEKQNFFAAQRKEKRRAEAAAQKKKQKRKKAIKIGAISTAAVLLVAGCTTWVAVKKPLTHMLPVMKTEHYQITAAELSFFAWQIYNQYLENNSDSDTLPDSTVALSDQMYDTDTTWEEYFLEAAQTYAKTVLNYCEVSYLAGYQAADDIPSVAKSSLDGFDLDTLPSGVTEEDVTDAMELYLLAWDFSTEQEADITVNEEEMETYYTEHAQEMQVCSYLSFSFSFDDSDETAMQLAEATELARELKRCTTEESFTNWVYTYYKENTSLTEEELQSQVSTLRTDEAEYNEEDEASLWAFDSDTKVGDTTMVTDATSGTLTVYLLVSAPERDETYPVDIRQIILTADTYESATAAHAAAEKVLEEYEAGEQTEDSFAALADQYTEDTTADGGLYTQVLKSDLMTTWSDWCFDSARQPGDVTILDSSYGSCVIYYVAAADMPAWQLTANDAVLSEKKTQWEEDCDTKAAVQTKEYLLRFVHAD